MPKWMVDRTYRFIVEGMDLPEAEQHLIYYAPVPQVEEDNLPRIAAVIQVSTNFTRLPEDNPTQAGQYRDTAGALRTDGRVPDEG